MSSPSRSTALDAALGLGPAQADARHRRDLDDRRALEREPAVLQPLGQLLAPLVEDAGELRLVPVHDERDLVVADPPQQRAGELR